jgi:hypothetical protein
MTYIIGAETKGVYRSDNVDHVRTPQGAAHYHLPIGAPIVLHQDQHVPQQRSPHYVPGHWTQASDVDLRNDYADTIGPFYSHLRREDVLFLAGEELHALRQAGTLPVVLVNGPHRIMFQPDMWGGYRSRAAELTKYVDELQSSPFALRHTLTIQVVDQATIASLNSTAAEASALTKQDSGMIWLGPSSFDPHQETVKSTPHFMPHREAPGVNYLKYVLAHEWGHAIDASHRPGHERQQKLWTKLKSKGASNYGSKNHVEGHAEAFAEWWLSNGQTINEFSRAYADFFGWY